MSGQASQLTRKEATQLQKNAECGSRSGKAGNGGDPEHSSQKGTVSNPKGAKG